jgi:hypothetical protein
MTGRVRKYQPGPMEDTQSIIARILLGEWVWFNHKPISGRFVANWSLKLIEWHIHSDRLRPAMINPEWKGDAA